MRAYYTPRARYNHSHPLADLQAQANVLGANASFATNEYAYCMIYDETRAGVAARGNVYLGKVSDFVSYIVAKTYLTTNYSTTAVCDTADYSMASGTVNSASITAQGAAIGMIQSQLVCLGLLTVANGIYREVASVSTFLTKCRS